VGSIVFSHAWQEHSHTADQERAEAGRIFLPAVLSLRLFGDTRPHNRQRHLTVSFRKLGSVRVGNRSRYWRRDDGWGEAGAAVSYLDRHPQIRECAPDWRRKSVLGKDSVTDRRTRRPDGFRTRMPRGISKTVRETISFLRADEHRGDAYRLARFRDKLFWNTNLSGFQEPGMVAQLCRDGSRGCGSDWQWMPRPLVFRSAGCAALISPALLRRTNFLCACRISFYGMRLLGSVSDRLDPACVRRTSYGSISR